MSLVSTFGGSSTNSYVTRDEALDYLADRLGSETIMEDIDEERLDKGLITASKLLDYRMVWIGSRATDTQSMEWPRVDIDDEYIYSETVIPPKIKQATIEMANYLLLLGEPLESAVLDAVQISSLKIDFKDTGSVRTLIPDQVASIVSEYGQRISTKPTLREVALYR